MNDRVTPNVGNETNAEYRIKNLTNELSKMQADFLNWKVSFTVDVEQLKDKQYQIVIHGFVGKTVLKEILSFNEIMYSFEDRSDLTRQIAEEFLVALLKDKAYNELVAPLSHAFDNVNTLIKNPTSL